MSEQSVTRLVVGPSRPLSLGRPVGQPGGFAVGASARTGLTLQLQQGPKTPVVARGATGFRLKLGLEHVRIRTPSRRAALIGAAAGAVVSVALVLALRPVGKPTSEAPLFGTAQQEPAGMTVLAQPYVAAGTAEGADLDRRLGGPLPTNVAPADLPAAPATPPLTSRPATAAAAATQQAEPAKTGKPAAVVLDEVPSSPATSKSAMSPAKPSLPTVSPPKPQGADRRPEQAHGQLTGAANAGAEPSRGRGLVAITPDGKVAVFTNPTTRMPEQFKVGDKLPTGDTVKGIDPQAGKVITTSKEYGLE